MQTRASSSRLPFLGLALLLALFLAALGGTSFQRRVEDFQPLGFSGLREQGVFQVEAVSAPETGLLPGDQILLVAGDPVTSEVGLRESLRRAVSTPLVVLRDQVPVNDVVYQRPALEIDYAYLLLVLTGVVYLLIGLYTVFKDGRGAARLFYLVCLISAALYILSHTGAVVDTTDKAIVIGDQLARSLLPALMLHLFLVFPTPLVSAFGRFLLPGIYLPSVLSISFHLDQFLGGSIYGQATDATVLLVLRLELYALVLAPLLASLILFVRLARHPEWDARRQIQWIALGMLGGYAPFLFFYVMPFSLGFGWQWTEIAGVLPLSLIPIGFAYAILKYKLWDIGIILRDSISYTLTVLVGLCGFALIHFSIQRGVAEDLAVARNFLTFAAGLVVAGVLVPMKGALSSQLERWQYRSTFAQRQALGRLGEEILYERDLMRLSTTLVDRLAEGLKAHTNLYVMQSAGTLAPMVPGDLLPREIGLGEIEDDLWEHDVTSLGPVELPGDKAPVTGRLFAAGYRYAFPLLVREHRVGILLVSYKFDDEPLNSEDLDLARGLLNQASLAIENAHLLEEVHQRLEEVERLEEHNKGIIESSPVGLVVLDGRSRVVSANDAFHRLIGGKEDVTDRKIEEILPVRPLPGPSEGLTEVSYCELSGRERYFQLSTAPYEQDARPLRILTVQDTTELIALESALKEKERLASLGLLAAGVAHEVNTPLTGISSYAQLLMDDVDENHPHYELLKKLERQTFRAAQIVNNLLEFSRNRHDELRQVNLAAVISESLHMLDERLDEAGIDVLWEPPREPARVLGHEGELHQVFTNLMVNAIQAMAASGGQLTVSLDSSSGQLRARVSDNGPGIAPERLERIFHPFFSSKGKGGTGLGLAITYNIVRRHRGTIRAENRSGDRGCTFTVELPCYQG